jgi:hypothetical protein
MKVLIIILISVFFNITQTFACDCECDGDCSFSVISKSAEFVALIKVISYDDFLNYEITGYDDKMPSSMTVEIIEKYKGKEVRKKIKIWGDNGAECRPYISTFIIGEYYIIAPKQLGEYRLEGESATDYDFFSCHSDYLKVDLTEKKAFGDYSKELKVIDLDVIKKELKK